MRHTAVTVRTPFTTMLLRDGMYVQHLRAAILLIGSHQGHFTLCKRNMRPCTRLLLTGLRGFSELSP